MNLKYCSVCQVSVESGVKRCPLCQSPLTQSYTKSEIFPHIESVYNRHAGYVKLVRFVFLTIAVLSVLINLFSQKEGAWSVLVVAAIACVWLWMFIAVRRRRNILKRLFDQVLIINVLAIFWDMLTGWQGWALNYVVPIVFICAMLTTTMLSRILKIPTADYILYGVLLIIFGVVPAVLLLTGLITVTLPAEACLFVSAVLLIRLLIFDWSILSHELKKRLHV